MSKHRINRKANRSREAGRGGDAAGSEALAKGGKVDGVAMPQGSTEHSLTMVTEARAAGIYPQVVLVGPGVVNPPTPAEATSDIEETPLAISAKQHLTLKSLIGLGLALIATTYSVMKYLEIEPLTRKLADAKESLTANETERTGLNLKLSSLQARYTELEKLENRPVLLLPPDGASLLGGCLTAEWDYVHQQFAEGYILEMRQISTVGDKPLVQGVARPETKRQYMDLGHDATGEYLWRVRPGVVSATGQTPHGPWSAWATFTMFPDVIHRVKATKKLLAATTPTSYDNFVATDGHGGYSGFEVELLQWIADSIQQSLGLPDKLLPALVEIPWNRLFQSVEAGEVDLAIRSISASKYREKEFHNLKFSVGYLTNHQVIIGRWDHKDDLTALEGTVVGVKTGSVNERAARHLVPHFKWKPNSTFTCYADIYQALQDGKIDVGLVDSVLAAKFLATRFKQIGPPLDAELKDFYRGELGTPTEEYAIVFHETEKTNALRDAINAVLTSAQGKKKLGELKQKYGLPD